MVKIAEAQEDRLRELRSAASAVDRAQAALQTLVRQAARDGIPPTHVAKAARIGRATLYRWIGDTES